MGIVAKKLTSEELQTVKNIKQEYSNLVNRNKLLETSTLEQSIHVKLLNKTTLELKEQHKQQQQQQ